MSGNTPIEWVDSSWSPWEGCQKVGPGCDNCYAEGMNRWLRRGENWGPGAARRVYGDKHWKKPGQWQRAAAKAGRTITVFPSVCDPFDNAAPDGQRARFAQLIIDTPNLTWLLLTKRIGNAAAMLAEMFPAGIPDNVWIGATIVDRAEMLRDAPKLKALKVRVRFWSVEPMLGDLGEIPRDLLPDWVIVGGESGRRARPIHLAWVRALRDQCEAAGVPLFFKQWGEWLPWVNFNDASIDDEPEATRYRTMEWQDDRWEDVGYPSWVDTADGFIDDEQCVGRVGKSAAGRLLDGRLHDAYPVVPIMPTAA